MKMEKLLVISGPSGVGKSTIVKRLLQIPCFTKSVSATTRKKRNGEIEGVDYHFYSLERFREALQKGEFLESAKIYGNLYGTPKRSFEEALKEGKILIMEIDSQGLQALKEKGYKPFSIFILPPDERELEKRLQGRGENLIDIRQRHAELKLEIKKRDLYDLCIVNTELEKTISQILAELKKRGMLSQTECKTS